MNSLGGIEYFLDPHKRIYWVFLGSSMLLGCFYLRGRSKKSLFSKAIWLHPSARLDYVYFIVMSVLKVLVIFPLILGAKSVALHTNIFLHDVFGYHHSSLLWGKWSVMLLYTGALFIVSDLTRYLLHRLMHRSKILWKFHKVHHSARVLTPFTLYRVHPVENILFGLRYGLSAGFVTGIFLYLFKSYLGVYTILGVNTIAFVFMAFGSNLRHSHVPLGFYTWAERLFISPKMHQMHHSKTMYNKNFGGYLSIWDHIFKTASFSHGITNLKFGLSHKEMKHYQTLMGLFFYPFKLKGNHE